MRQRALQLALAVSLALAPAASHALPIGLGLVIDSSGSISVEDFELQRDAYILAILNPFLIPLDGSIAIAISQFSTGAVQVADTRLINSQADKDFLVAALEAMTRLDNNTCISCGISRVFTDLILWDEAGLDAFDSVIIDVSTDGMNNTPPPISNANFVLEGTIEFVLDQGVDQINCLGVGGDANCDFIAGEGAFAIQVDSFADFGAALEEKIGRETPPPTNPIPEPTTALLMGLGLFALAGRLRVAA